MEFYAKIKVYEELELQPAPAGLIHASVWKHPAYKAVVFVLGAHKKINQDGIERVYITIKRILNKKIRDDGSIWLNENEYEIIKIVEKRPQPRIVEGYANAPDPDEIMKEDLLDWKDFQFNDP